MANNGLLVSGVCSTVDVYVSYLVSNNSSCSGRYPIYYPKDLNIACQGSTWISLGYRPPYNCEIPGPPLPSTIPTVADGIALGWQAGGALILVGCILFLKKALK